MSSRRGARRRPATSSGGDSASEIGATAVSAPSSPTSARPRRRPPSSPRPSSSSALFELAGEEYQFYLEEGGGGGRDNPRSFSHGVKAQCWDKAEKVRGRDPDRWRRDYLGNVLFRKLVGCPGCYCHDYDHIVPYSKASLLAELGSSHHSQVSFVAAGLPIPVQAPASCVCRAPIRERSG